MDISFILSTDEIFTLMSIARMRSAEGEAFITEALADAEICDLSGLVEKKFARYTNGELSIDPIVRMIADSLAMAESIAIREESWFVNAPWVSLIIQVCEYRKDHWKITPIQKGEADV